MTFVDSSFWIALLTGRDQHHDEAVKLWQTHRNWPLTTSNVVRGETWTFIRRRNGHRDAVTFLDSFEHSSRLRVVSISDPIERDALAWLRRHDERVYSFVDATSFMLMRSLGIQQALAFDGDFSAAGFIELRA